MKYLLSVIAMTIFFFTADAQIKSATLTASGLTCSMCSKSIFKALEKVPSVSSVDVDIDKSVFTIQFRKDAIVRADDIKNAVTDAGFAVAALQFTADFPATAVAPDQHIRFAGSTYHFLDVSPQTIEGERTFTIVDKDFVSAASYRRYRKATAMKCYETGKTEPCCASDIPAGTRIYHITL